LIARTVVKEVDITSDVIIERSLDVVAAYAADPQNAPKWYANIRSVEWITPPPMRVGSQIAFVAHFLGRRLAYTYEIAEWAPAERLVMRTSQGPFPMETRYTWERLGESRTRMTLQNRGAPSGFSRFVAVFMSIAMKQANRKDLACLKRLLESA
jgi:hypothetical protein